MKRNLLSLATLLFAMLFSVNAFAVDEEILAANTAKVEGATAENPITTDFVVNGTFDNEVAPWQTTTGAQNKALATNQTGAFTGRFYENWNPSPYVGKMYQTIENIPNGVYELKICAFVNVFDGNCQYVYANEAKTNLTTGAPTAYSVFVEVTTNAIEVGLEQTEAKTEWMGIDNISLTYFGAEATIDDARFGSYIKAVADLRAFLTESKAKVSAGVNAIIDEALTATETIEKTEEAYKDAVAKLTVASDATKLSISQKTVIDNYYDLMKSTNVYSQAGYDTFKAAADDYLAKWDAGTLTEALVNPYAIQGWRSANIYDDFLLSAFGTKDFDTDLYINTWSVEGENDGSNFKVPFFEYWTGNGSSLAATTKTATVAGLEANKAYSVTAWVRVRVKDGVSDPATGITLSVGAEGTPVSVTTGEAAGTAQMYHGTFIANGKTDAEGNLTINFNVAADNNISWLSFKNIVYKEIYEPTNLDFAVGTPVDNGICTYAKDMETNSTTYSQLLPVEGWNIAVENGDARAGGLFAYGSEKWLGGAGYNAPATNPEGAAEGNALGVIGVWDAVAQYTQPITLAAGNYVITVPVYNAGAGTAAPQKNLVGFIADDGTEYLADAKSYASDKWSTITVSFTLKQQTNGVISLGFDAPNSGSSANQHLFYDRVEIKAISDAELAKVELAQVIADANATVDAKAGVGEGLFMIPTAAYDTYAAAVVAAQAVYDNAEATADDVTAAIEALAAATATYAATPATAPAADKTYQIMHQEAGTFLTLNGAVKVEAEASPLSFVAADGKYYIANANGEYAYYSGTGNNTWSLSVSADNKEAWTIAAVGEGVYTIKGKNGFLGTDAATAGSTCYGNKAATNWVITEYDPNCVKTYNIEIADVKVADWTAEVLVDAATINEIATLLGATPADLTYQLVDTTGVRTDYNGNPGEILFWVDLDGNKSNWGVNNKFYVLYDAAVPQITATQFGAAEGDVLNVTVRLANAEGKYVEIVVTENIYKTPVTTPADYEIVKEYDVVFDYNVVSGEVTATFPDTEIAELLGVESFTFNEILTTDAEGNIVFTHTANTGYWMTAEGVPCKWGTADMCYFIEYREFGSGTFYLGDAGVFDANSTLTNTFYVVVDGKAVQLNITINVGEAVAIEGISAEDVLKTEYFGLNGASLNAPVKGINIVKTTLKNGKVVTTKTFVK